MIMSLCAIALSTLGQVNSAGPRCSAPPRDATDNCVACYDQACVIWINEFYRCDGNFDCLKTAKENYDDALQVCKCRPAASILASVLGPERAEEYLSLFFFGARQ